MPDWYEYLVYGGTLLFSVAATARYLGWALKRQLLDHPGPRSSHGLPRPTGGGAGMVAAVTLGFVLLAVSTQPAALYWTALGAALLLAVTGMLDDRRGLAVTLRLGLQCACAAALCLTAWVSSAGAGSVLMLAIAFLALIWLTNLFNFMDGIDGIAASEAICIAAGAVLLLPLDPVALRLLCLLALAAAGFLRFNWPPARLFMGDTGSLFLGFLLAACAFASVWQQTVSVWPWLILWSCFLCDASTTLLLRVLRGESAHEAHRDHAYQRLSRRFASHRGVTVGLIVINLCYLWPLAWSSLRWPGAAPWLFLLASLPLVALVVALEIVDRAAPGESGQSA